MEPPTQAEAEATKPKDAKVLRPTLPWGLTISEAVGAASALVLVLTVCYVLGFSGGARFNVFLILSIGDYLGIGAGWIAQLFVALVISTLVTWGPILLLSFMMNKYKSKLGSVTAITTAFILNALVVRYVELAPRPGIFVNLGLGSGVIMVSFIVCMLPIMIDTMKVFALKYRLVAYYLSAASITAMSVGAGWGDAWAKSATQSSEQRYAVSVEGRETPLVGVLVLSSERYVLLNQEGITGLTVLPSSQLRMLRPLPAGGAFADSLRRGPREAASRPPGQSTSPPVRSQPR